MGCAPLAPLHQYNPHFYFKKKIVELSFVEKLSIISKAHGRIQILIV